MLLVLLNNHSGKNNSIKDFKLKAHLFTRISEKNVLIFPSVMMDPHSSSNIIQSEYHHTSVKIKIIKFLENAHNFQWQISINIILPIRSIAFGMRKRINLG